MKSVILINFVLVQVLKHLLFNSTAHNPILPSQLFLRAHDHSHSHISLYLLQVSASCHPPHTWNALMSFPLPPGPTSNPSSLLIFINPSLNDLILLRLPLCFMIWHLVRSRWKVIGRKKNASFGGRQMRFKSQLSRSLVCDVRNSFIFSGP